MNNTTKIILSIIVPVYNVEDYLVECLDSLVTQDIPYNEYEIICIDDGSTDKSGEILDSYAEKYTNIVVIHKENGGVGSARNYGINIAKGEYLWFIDADDFIRNNCLSFVKSKILGCSYDVIKIVPYSFAHGDVAFFKDKITPEMSQRYLKNFLWTKIFRKKHITENEIYFEIDIAYAEDAIFIFQLSPFLRSEVRVDDMVIYFYRQRSGSAMSYNLNKKIQSRINGALVCEEIIEGKRVGDIESAYRFKYTSIVKIMEMAIKLSKTERNEILKDLKSKKLFPLKYNSKYTPKSRKGKFSITKKIIKVLSDFSYTKIGYFFLCVFVDFKYSLKRIFH